MVDWRDSSWATKFSLQSRTKTHPVHKALDLIRHMSNGVSRQSPVEFRKENHRIFTREGIKTKIFCYYYCNQKIHNAKRF